MEFFRVQGVILGEMFINEQYIKNQAKHFLLRLLVSHYSSSRYGGDPFVAYSVVWFCPDSIFLHRSRKNHLIYKASGVSERCNNQTNSYAEKKNRIIKK